MKKKDIFENSLFVIKISGKILMDYSLLYNVLNQIHYIINNINGLKVILITGFGKQVDDLLQTLYNKKSIKIDGRRITDKEEIEIIKMVSGLNMINVQSILVKLKVFHHLMPAIHPDYIICEKRKDSKHDFKYVGDIKKVNDSMLLDLLVNRDVVVASSMLFDINSLDLLNVNADSLATQIAVSTKAKKLIFISDVDGVYDKNKNLIHKIYDEKIDKLISEKIVSDGMIVKLENIKKSLNEGLESIHITSGLNNSLLEIINQDSAGTLFLNKND